MNILNSANTAETINKIIHNAQGTTKTSEGATAAGKIIKENLPDIISAGFDMPRPTSVFEGVPPFSFISNGTPLLNWIIYGNTGGVGNKVKITLDVPLNGIGTYKDTLILSTGKLTRNVNIYAFDGSENWVRTSNGAYYLPSTDNPMNNYKFINANISINSHFESQGTVSASSYVNDGKSAFFYNSGNATREYYVAARNILTAEDFKTYLATQYANGTPVTVWYILETPTETTITVPTGMTGTIEGYTTQTGTPTPETPIYPTSNGTLQPDDSYLVYTAYKIPVICGNTTTNIYIDEPLTSGETISYSDTGVMIPTKMFLNTLSVDTTVQPEKVFIEYVK